MPTTRTLAPHAPIAQILPLLGVSQLDRIFEYKIDTDQDADAQPGVLVRIRFAGRLVNGILLERVAEPIHQGDLRWLDRVISPEIIYSPATRALIESLALRYGAITSDVIRAAIPSRHAQAEQTDTTTAWEELGKTSEPDLSPWSAYEHGEAFVDAVLAGKVARVAWQMTPQEPWADALAALAVKVVLQGKGALLIVPNQKDIEQLVAACSQYVSPKQITVLNSQQGPQARYRRFLSVLHGQGRLVIGTRSAAFAPVANLGLVVIKDDGDDNLVDPRAPYIHAREVLTTRSSLEHASIILAGLTRTAEVQVLVEAGWVYSLAANRDTIRKRMPRIHATGEHEFELERDRFAKNSRLPSRAFQAIRRSLEQGRPALVQVPRKGYVPTLACKKCSSPARCRACNGPLGIPPQSETINSGAQPVLLGPQRQSQALPPAHAGAYVPTCGWCGTPDTHFSCGQCGNRQLRAVVQGHRRTLEEFGVAFPQTPIVASGGNRIYETLPSRPGIVVATPGAEPIITDGPTYGAAVLLDSWALLNRQDLRATEDTFAKWTHAASLVVSHEQGGEVIVVADASLAVVQRFIRWDVIGMAQQELASRREVGFPPAVHMAAVDAPARALHQFMELLELPAGSDILGPVDLPLGMKLPGDYDQQEFGPPQRILVRTPLGPRNQLGAALRAAQTARLARRDSLPLRIQINPIHIG
ncbi:primosomal protein N' [Corynebacterium sp. HS2168-gen11]|uniref:primosomal protein N' n=1 Tax=Corynebacterium sp. HS2168-gen11 TaxID=2974027 RepID=UPI00216B6318|nr:primosomal protein N' [Corynebacterium sp. HS2168-gen11]MCS4535148.1 primosomal protein N' [Corynebacterium sp. HS2168-gen11]